MSKRTAHVDRLGGPLGRSGGRLRDWALLVALALVLPLAMGALTWRALAGEEAAVREQMAAELDSSAGRLRAGMEAALGRLDDASAPAGAPFADALEVRPEPAALTAAVPDRKRIEACRRDAEAWRRHQPGARARLLARCEAVRSPGGRMLWPVVALGGEGVSAERLAAWLGAHGSELGDAERQATRGEILAARWLASGERARLAATLEPADAAAALRSLWAPRRAAMRAGRARIRWRERGSAGMLKRQPDGGYRGYAVHRGSLARALGRGWPALPEGMFAQLSAGASDTAAGEARATRAVLLWPGGAALRIGYRDPAAAGRRAKRVLLALAIGALLLGLGLAALLFRRVVRERRLSALRTDFVAAVSHELRTPITTVRMLAELLASGGAPPDERAELHATLAHEATRLGRTVDRLLGFSRMQAGKRHAAPQPSDVSEVVASAIDDFERRQPDAAPVDRKLAPGVRARLDRELLSTAVDNLLANAAKYAPEAAPYEVTVARVGDWVRIGVRDEGPGIARRDRRRIFRPFERAAHDRRAASVFRRGAAAAHCRSRRGSFARVARFAPRHRGAARGTEMTVRRGRRGGGARLASRRGQQPRSFPTRAPKRRQHRAAMAPRREGRVRPGRTRRR